MRVDTGVLAHDMRYFAIAYAIAIGAAFLPLEPVWLKWIVAVVLFVHLRLVRQGPLRGRRRRRRSRTSRRCASTASTVAAHREDPADAAPAGRQRAGPRRARADHRSARSSSSTRSSTLATTLGVDRALLALVIAPIATELPEKFNSVIWVRQGKDTLAMGNITGAMVFQSDDPDGRRAALRVGHLGRRSEGSYVAFASAGIAFLSSAVIFIPMARRGSLRGRSLLVGGVFYLAYLALVVGVVSGASSAAEPDDPLIYSRRPQRRSPTRC